MTLGEYKEARGVEIKQTIKSALLYYYLNYLNYIINIE